MNKNYSAIVWFVVIVLLCQLNANAQDIGEKRPRVGLVLSGGGAKGLAHIPVLKMIEKYKIPIDYITGTSMGSVIGSLYSIGYSADEIEQIARSMNWDEIFDGSTERRLISIEEKDLEGKYVLEVPVKKGKPVIPTGLISGQKLEMELAKLTWSFHGIHDFSKFPIPFACIATDIESGEAVVLDKGYLPDVVRASMSIPSVFTAVKIDSLLLVDGGIVRNFPVSDVRKMGADIVIGVDVGSPLYKKEQLNSMLKIMEQAASFINDRNNKHETKLVDILIKPNIEGYGASSFNDVDSLMLRGELAALKVENEFITLKNKLNKYQSVKKNIKTPPSLYSIYITRIRYEGLQKVSKGMIRSKLQLEDSSWISQFDIEKGIAKLYGSKYFEKVNYRIEQIEDGKMELIIKIKEQPFSKYKIGVNYNNYFNASLLLNGTFRNMLFEGSRLLVTGKLGFYPEVDVDYTIFTKWKPSVGLRAKGEFYNLTETIYGIGDTLNLLVDNYTFKGSLGFASSISNSVMFDMGARISYRFLHADNINHATSVPDRSNLSFYSSIKLDTYDRNIYPENGASIYIGGEYFARELYTTNYRFDKSYWKVVFDYEQYFKIGDKFNYSHSLYAGVSFADSLFYCDRYFLGGEQNYKNYIFPLSGFQFMRLMGQNFVTAGITLRYEPWQNKFLFVEGNSAVIEDKLDILSKPGYTYLGLSVGVGLKSFIGPIEYRISKNNYNDEINHWVQIGYVF